MCGYSRKLNSVDTMATRRYCFGMSESLQYLTDEHGERTAVVLPISEYKKLLQDLEDIAVVAERRNEPTTPHAQFVSELKRDGIL